MFGKGVYFAGELSRHRVVTTELVIIACGPFFVLDHLDSVVTIAIPQLFLALFIVVVVLCHLQIWRLRLDSLLSSNNMIGCFCKTVCKLLFHKSQ